jgi:hypothetical protein
MQNRFTEIQSEFKEIKELLEKDISLNQKEFVINKFNKLNEICLDSQKVLIRESINTYKWSFKMKFMQSKLLEIIDPYNFQADSKLNFILKFIQYLNSDQCMSTELNRKFVEYLKSSPSNNLEKEFGMSYKEEMEKLKNNIQNGMNQTDLIGNQSNQNSKTYHYLESVKNIDNATLGIEDSFFQFYQNPPINSNYDITTIEKIDFGLLRDPFNDNNSVTIDQQSICNLDVDVLKTVSDPFNGNSLGTLNQPTICNLGEDLIKTDSVMDSLFQ